MKNAFFIIDPQNDFVDPKGSLCVPGAEDDMTRLAGFISKNKSDIDGVVMTMDTHNIMDIAHPAYWLDPEGKHPTPFTSISKKEAKGRRYTVNMPGTPDDVVLEKQKMVIDYLEDLESFDKSHTIWPEHCIQGTWGHNVCDVLMTSIVDWVREKGRDYVLYPKGMYPNSEHYGAFRAEVPDPTAPETTIAAAHNILKYMDNFENIYLCGEAKSHCVANTLSQIIDMINGEDVDGEFDDLIGRYVIVEDVMTDVPGFEDMNKAVFDKARKMGFRFTKLDEIKL